MKEQASPPSGGGTGQRKSSSRAWPSLEISTRVTLVFATPSTLWLFWGKGPDLVVTMWTPASSSMKWQWLQAHSEKGLASLGKWWATRQGKGVCSDCQRLAPRDMTPGDAPGAHTPIQARWRVCMVSAQLTGVTSVVNPVCHTVRPLRKGAASCESGAIRGSALGGGACGLG